MKFCRLVRTFFLTLGLLAVCCQPVLAFDTAQNDNYLLLVNQEHKLSEDWKAADMVDIAGLAPSTKSSMLLRDAVANAYLDMYAAYQAEKGLSMRTVSGYRSYATQNSLFNSRVASRQSAGQSRESAVRNTALYTAYPGASEHQTGMALDLSTGGGLSNNFRNTAQGQWMLSRCWDFGFILRYTSEKTPITGIAYEPWHYRYVGLPHAWIIRDNNWALEEYMHALHSLAEGQYLEYADLAYEDMLYRVYYTKDTAQEFADVVNISSDNCGGYVITTHGWNEELLNMPAETAMTLNGQAVELSQTPYVLDGTTMVPMRVIFEALAAGVSYDAESHTIVAGGAGGITLTPEQYITVDDVAMVPLRLVSEELQASVAWDAENQTISIYHSGDEIKIVLGRDSRHQAKRVREIM